MLDLLRKRIINPKAHFLEDFFTLQAFAGCYAKVALKRRCKPSWIGITNNIGNLCNRAVWLTQQLFSQLHPLLRQIGKGR